MSLADSCWVHTAFIWLKRLSVVGTRSARFMYSYVESSGKNDQRPYALKGKTSPASVVSRKVNVWTYPLRLHMWLYGVVIAWLLIVSKVSFFVPVPPPGRQASFALLLIALLCRLPKRRKSNTVLVLRVKPASRSVSLHTPS